MDLFNFNPTPRFIRIEKKLLALKPFSIRILALIESEFGSSKAFQDRLQLATENIYKEKFASAISWLAYSLLQNSKFESLIEFRAKFFREKTKNYFYNVETIFKVITDSQPLHQNIKKDAGRTDDDADTFFSMCYVAIARELKYTIEQFYDLTLRQIIQIQLDLQHFKRQDLDFMAKLHGAKLSLPSSIQNFEVPFSKKEDQILKNFAAKTSQDRAKQFDLEKKC